MTETELIDKYICQHIEPEGDYLYRLYRATNIHTIHGRMASGHIQGRLLKMLVQMVRPKNILEVGTFSGYSAICLAQGLQEGGKLYTFEINDEMEDFTRPWIEGSDVADKIDFRIGDANVEAPKLGVMFDLAFVDGDKFDTHQKEIRILIKNSIRHWRIQIRQWRTYIRHCRTSIRQHRIDFLFPYNI